MVDIYILYYCVFFCESGVKNDGMSDQEKPSIQNRGSAAAATNNNNSAPPPDRPGSARSNRDRHERVILLKERQNSERVKKLEELKEQVSKNGRNKISYNFFSVLITSRTTSIRQ